MKTHLNTRPILEYQFFSQDNRALSKLDDHLFSYNDEAPIGAGQNTVFLLGIFSTTGKKYDDRRRYIRTTYLATGDERMCKLSEYIRQVKETPNERRCQVPYTFVIGAGGSGRPTDHGDDEPLTLETDANGNVDPEGDCTYLNIKENMEDGKSTTYMKFGAQLAEEHGIDYIAKIDDDSVLSDKLLFQFIEDDLPPAPYNRRIYGGTSWASYGHSIMYAAGQFYFLSSDLANYVANGLTVEKRKEMMHFRPTEDGDMGTFVFSHPRPVKFMNLSTYRFWSHPKKTEADFLKGWGDMWKLPSRGNMMPFFHLCPAWMQGKGI
mmetsp:Transcript_20757/g.30426  ORF Transcript_20757/g.30426 Transcript_20757/m.30426 type:complete len:321 (-) Transcript_20757:70-1032(-)